MNIKDINEPFFTDLYSKTLPLLEIEETKEVRVKTWDAGECYAEDEMCDGELHRSVRRSFWSGRGMDIQIREEKPCDGHCIHWRRMTFAKWVEGEFPY